MDSRRVDPRIHEIHPNFLTEEECKHIGYILTRDEHKILRIPNTYDSSYTGLTKQHEVYNLLEHPDIRPLKIPQRIFNLPLFQQEDTLRFQCWGNILRHNEGLDNHVHGSEDEAPIEILEQKNQFYACNVFIDGQEPSYTHYEDIGKTRNIKGEMHIVGCMVEHGVRTNLYAQPRLSIAMDVYTPLGFNQLDLDILNGVSKRRHMEFHR